MGRLGGWADIGNLYVDPDSRRQGIGTWLMAQAAGWLDLGDVSRVLGYTEADQTGERGFLEAVGFHPLTRTERGFTLPAARQDPRH